jgi:hypothetical protein
MLYLTFWKETEAGKLYAFQRSYESPKIMMFVLFILTIGSIFSGYFLQDAFVGIGSSYWGSTIFIDSINQNSFELEYIGFYKHLPLIFSSCGFFLCLDFFYNLKKYLIDSIYTKYVLDYGSHLFKPNTAYVFICIIEQFVYYFCLLIKVLKRVFGIFKLLKCRVFKIFKLLQYLPVRRLLRTLLTVIKVKLRVLLRFIWFKLILLNKKLKVLIFKIFVIQRLRLSVSILLIIIVLHKKLKPFLLILNGWLRWLVMNWNIFYCRTLLYFCEFELIKWFKRLAWVNKKWKKMPLYRIILFIWKVKALKKEVRQINILVRSKVSSLNIGQTIKKFLSKILNCCLIYKKIILSMFIFKIKVLIFNIECCLFDISEIISKKFYDLSTRLLVCYRLFFIFENGGFFIYLLRCCFLDIIFWFKGIFWSFFLYIKVFYFYLKYSKFGSYVIIIRVFCLQFCVWLLQFIFFLCDEWQLAIANYFFKIIWFLYNRWYLDYCYNYYIGFWVLDFAYTNVYKLLDKGVFEILLAQGIANVIGSCIRSGQIKNKSELFQLICLLLMSLILMLYIILCI